MSAPLFQTGIKALALLFMLSVVRCQDLSPDQKVLLDFKESQRKDCDGYDETFFGSWRSNSTKWAGVTFTQSGVVSKLDLGCKKLCGTLPPSFGRLLGLTSIRLHNNYWTSMTLSYNSWEGSLPVAWSSLVQLTELNISQSEYADSTPSPHNKITGPVPKAWSTLVNLRTLDLSQNHLTGTLPELPSSLRHFNLSYNDFSGPAPEAWSKLVHLTCMDVSYLDGFTGTLPQAWSVLGDLGSITLTFTGFVGTLPEPWSELVNLSSLELSNNNFTGTVPKSWSRLVNLTTLDVSSNSLTGTLPELLSELVQLTTLSLHFNHFTGTLPECFSKLVGLSSLSAYSNMLSGTVPELLSTLTKLSFLSLDSNTFTGTLPNAVSNLVHLTELGLSLNNFTGTLPEAWSSLVKLQSVYIDSNSLTGTVPKAWSSLVVATWLGLSYNKFTGSLPESWSSLVSLQDLYLNDNKFSGTLPKSWSKLVNLYSMDLSTNSLTGTLPASWSSLVRLYEMYLSRNKFSGPLPTSWRSLSLQHLRLSDNDLTGTLPETWSMLTILNSLDLSKNKFTGVLPESWDMLTLSSLNLSSNSFSPQPVPESWITTLWEFVAVLDMSSMGLTGPLPAIPYASVVNMSNNSLTGSIADIPEFVMYVNLAANKLTGSIPDVNSTNLVYLDLANNQLDKLPEYLEAPNATFLSLANNSLAGSIPDYPNHSLTYCDLRNNSLVGTIPRSWTRRAWAFLALSYNKLSGELPDVWQGNVSILLLQNNSMGGCLSESWLHNNSMSILSLSNNSFACQLPVAYAGDAIFSKLGGMYLDGNQFTGTVPVEWMSSFRSSSSGENATILYLGSMWRQSSELSQRHGVLPSSDKNWRKSVCLSRDLNDRLTGLIQPEIPGNVVRQVQASLNLALAPLQDYAPITIQLSPVTLQLSGQPQPSVEEICRNPQAPMIVVVQWALVASLLGLMVGVYFAEKRFALLARRGPKRAFIMLHWAEHLPLLKSAGVVLMRLVGVMFYWFDVGTDIYLLYKVLAGNSRWAPWVLLTILLLHYVVGAGLLGWYFTVKHRYLLVVCVALVPVMPLVDTVAAFMAVVPHGGPVTSRMHSAVAVDWQAVFDLRHALEFLLESVPMALLQTAIFVVGNKPGVGVYLDNWTYVLSAAGTCFQILGMAGLILWQSARDHKSPWQVLCGFLTLPRNAQSHAPSSQVQELAEDSQSLRVAVWRGAQLRG